MKNLNIFYSKRNPYLKQFALEAEKINLTVELYQYELFSFENDHITYNKGKKFKDFDKNDVLLFRFCPYEKKQYHFWLKLLASLAKKNGAKIINENLMLNFPFQSDKLFQAAYFSTQQIPHIETYRLNRKLKQATYPLLIKKRNTSMGMDSHIIKSEEELLDAKRKLKNLDDYIVQPFLELERDIRVLILNKEVVGVVNRQVKLMENQIAVKMGATTNLIFSEQKIVQQVIKSFESDLLGLDIFTSKNGKIWLGEVNFFPGFSGFMRVSNENIFRKILLMMANS